MEATIQSNQMDVDKEEARPNPEVSNLPQERHIWRIPELPPMSQGMNHFQVAAIGIYQCQYKNWFRAAKEEEWEICPNLWEGAMNSYLHIKSFLGQEKTIEVLGDWILFSCKEKFKKLKNWVKNQSLSSIDHKKELEMTQDLETESPVVSTSCKPAPEVSKDKPKGPQKKKKGPNSHKGKGKGNAYWHSPYPQGYRIPKLELSAMDSVLNMARTLMEFTAKDHERLLKDHVLEITKNTNQFATHLAKSDSERQKLKNEISENVEQTHKNYEPHMPRHPTPLTEEKHFVKGSLTPFLGENPICAKDIPKREKLPALSGEGEYNHI
ncbi:hypothetical protein O181_066866 [Austropuccinia psidii MF-1]|uniref:Uncharacterized protein n=1 Tax=Austropuccinia psidii MF-1 TaxID=1389203 RepID=A0A9Q3EYH5_9BASI|nr:hypothetical protein [Austropuccinia psidii MF-1]